MFLFFNNNDIMLMFLLQGRWKEAKELDLQVMETTKRVLGEAHPDTLTSMNNLAHTYYLQDHRDTAIELMEEIFELRKKNLGPDHPYTIDSINALKDWMDALGRI